jgi:hypothetical protein
MSPDVLGVPTGPGNHRPHRDYEDTQAYCAQCYEPWPCQAHQGLREGEAVEEWWDAARVDDERAADAEREAGL